MSDETRDLGETRTPSETRSMRTKRDRKTRKLPRYVHRPVDPFEVFADLKAHRILVYEERWHSAAQNTCGFAVRSRYRGGSLSHPQKHLLRSLFNTDAGKVPRWTALSKRNGVISVGLIDLELDAYMGFMRSVRGEGDGKDGRDEFPF